MSKEIRFTTQNFADSGDNDCGLDPNDPMYEYIRTGNIDALNKPAKIPLTQQAEEYQRKLALAKEQGIRPGSPAWHLL